MHMKPPPALTPQGGIEQGRTVAGGDTPMAPGASERTPRGSVSERDARAPARTRSAFVPTLLGLLALAGTLGFQAWQLASDRTALKAAHAGQQQTVDSAGKLRASLDALAADTQRLADTGNANAALLVAELKKRGITINAAAPAAVQTPAPGASR